VLTILSPAKSIDPARRVPAKSLTEPVFAERADQLAARLRRLSRPKLKALLGVSDELVELSRERWSAWPEPIEGEAAGPAIALFAGDVYRGFDAPSMTAARCRAAQSTLRILSGLYGVLRPLDEIRPYRLEMGSDLPVGRAPSLAAWWRPVVTESLRAELESADAPCLVNLASNEYAAAVDAKSLGRPIVTCVFQQLVGGKRRSMSFYAKHARGRMARWIVEERPASTDDLRAFDLDDYRFAADASTDRKLVFDRPKPPPMRG